MENIRRDSILGMFFDSFRGMARNSKTEENGRVTDEDLDLKERKFVSELRKMNKGRLPSLTEVDPEKANRLNRIMKEAANNKRSIAKDPEHKVKGHRVIEEDGDRDR